MNLTRDQVRKIVMEFDQTRSEFIQFLSEDERDPYEFHYATISLPPQFWLEEPDGSHPILWSRGDVHYPYLDTLQFLSRSREDQGATPSQA